MNDLVERACEAVTTDNAIIYNPHSCLSAFENFHPIVCGQPAFDSIDYGDYKVYLCLKHWNDTNVGSRRVYAEGLHWKYLEDDNDKPQPPNEVTN
jgi:hypothetical protein